MSIKVAYVTGTRAEFGIVSALLQAIDASSDFTLQLYATGMQLMPEYGSTIKVVKKKFPTVQILPAVYKPQEASGTAAFLAQLFPQLVDAFIKNKPEIVFVHGDRAEMLAVATLCLYLHIPVFHTQGGDISATDDNTARHAISKLATIHFPATNQAKKNLLSIGVSQKYIHVVGTLSLDTLQSVDIVSKEIILKKLKVDAADYILITMHPVSEEIEQAAAQMCAVLEAASETGLPIVLIYPNADPGSSDMVTIIKEWEKRPHFYAFKNIEYEDFISLCAHAKVWVGNSSAGIVDSPFLKVPTINVGLRQQGRELSKNIISVPAKKLAIEHALETALTDAVFIKKVKSVKNKWGKGKAVLNIMRVLREYAETKRSS